MVVGCCIGYGPNPSVVRRLLLREELGTPGCKKSSSVEVPSVGVEIVEILHGGVGGDVEQGARTSKQIFVFAL